MSREQIATPDDIDVARTKHTPDERSKVKARVREQVAQVTRPVTKDKERAVLDRLVRDRRSRADRVNVDVVDDRDGHLLVASDTRLAEVDSLDAATRARAEQIPGLPGIVMVPGDVSASADAPPTRPNYVTPMGVVVKSLSGPEPPAAAPPRWRPGRAVERPVKVAVIDTGVNRDDRGDEWLVDLEPSERDELYPRQDGILGLGAGHGTFVAGVVQQLAPRARIKVYNPLKDDGLGTEVDVALAMLDAAFEWGADIINLSLGIETLDDEPPLALRAAVEAIANADRDVLMIAAAGNTGRDRECWPGAFPQVTAVAGLTIDGASAAWSTRGSWVDCSTIGEGILSTYVKGTEDELVDQVHPDDFGSDAWALWTGTSFAAPQVAGAVAQLAGRRSIGARDALQRLLAKGTPDPAHEYGTMVRLLNPGDLDRPMEPAPVT